MLWSGLRTAILDLWQASRPVQSNSSSQVAHHYHSTKTTTQFAGCLDINPLKLNAEVASITDFTLLSSVWRHIWHSVTLCFSLVKCPNLLTVQTSNSSSPMEIFKRDFILKLLHYLTCSSHILFLVLHTHKGHATQYTWRTEQSGS